MSYKIAVIVAVCSLLLVIPSLTRKNQDGDPFWDESDEEWFQGDDPNADTDAIVEADVDAVVDADVDAGTDTDTDTDADADADADIDRDDGKDMGGETDSNSNQATLRNTNGAAFIKHMFHYNSIMQLNGRINDSLSSSYTYLTLAFFFDRADVALPGFHKFMMEASNKEKENAFKLMKYMNKRGGWFKLRRIVAEERDWKSGLDVLKFMLEHEKNMNANFLYTHKVASDHDDGHLTDFLEGEFLEPRVEFIKKLANYISNLKSFTADYNLGEYILDNEL